MYFVIEEKLSEWWSLWFLIVFYLLGSPDCTSEVRFSTHYLLYRTIIPFPAYACPRVLIWYGCRLLFWPCSLHDMSLPSWPYSYTEENPHENIWLPGTAWHLHHKNACEIKLQEMCSEIKETFSPLQTHILHTCLFCWNILDFYPPNMRAIQWAVRDYDWISFIL